MSLKPNSDSSTAPEFSQAQIDAHFPSSGLTSLWKLATPGCLQLSSALVNSGASVRVTGPQLAADGSVLQASQTFNMSASDLALLNLPAGFVIAGP